MFQGVEDLINARRGSGSVYLNTGQKCHLNKIQDFSSSTSFVQSRPFINIFIYIFIIYIYIIYIHLSPFSIHNWINSGISYSLAIFITLLTTLTFKSSTVTLRFHTFASNSQIFFLLFSFVLATGSYLVINTLLSSPNYISSQFILQFSRSSLDLKAPPPLPKTYFSSTL